MSRGGRSLWCAGCWPHAAASPRSPRPACSPPRRHALGQSAGDDQYEDPFARRGPAGAAEPGHAGRRTAAGVRSPRRAAPEPAPAATGQEPAPAESSPPATTAPGSSSRAPAPTRAPSCSPARSCSPAASPCASACVSARSESDAPEATERAGAELAAQLRPGDVVLVSGELGAGKTTFVRGALRALGVTEAVTSPTFVVGVLYDGADGPARAPRPLPPRRARRRGPRPARPLLRRRTPSRSSSGPSGRSPRSCSAAARSRAT